MGMSAYGNQEIGFSQLSLDDRIYLAQSDVIRKVAEEGPCVVVGRCADYILKETPNVINIFVYADMEFRKERAIRVNNLNPVKAEEAILKMDKRRANYYNDKRRANYYNYHSGEKWGKATNYHLSVNSGFIGIDNTVDCIKAFIDRIPD